MTDLELLDMALNMLNILVSAASIQDNIYVISSDLMHAHIKVCFMSPEWNSAVQVMDMAPVVQVSLRYASRRLHC